MGEIRDVEVHFDVEGIEVRGEFIGTRDEAEAFKRRWEAYQAEQSEDSSNGGGG